MEIAAWLAMQSYAGIVYYPIRVVGETPKRYRIQSDECVPLGGRSRTLSPGEKALVPKRAIVFRLPKDPSVRHR